MQPVTGRPERALVLEEVAPGRRSRLAVLGAVFCLCAILATSQAFAGAHTRFEDAAAVQDLQILWGGSDGAAMPSGVAAPSARRSQLADFEPAKLYTDPPETDLDHENRIDNYACLFSDCEGTKKPLLQTGILFIFFNATFVAIALTLLGPPSLSI